MFDQLAKRSNRLRVYTTGRFAEERRAFLCDLSKGGRSLPTLRNINRLLLVIAERVNIRQGTPITERQIVRAADDWVKTSCGLSSKTETRDIQRRRFNFVAKHWFRFLGKWRDPIRNPQFKPQLDSFLKELRDERGYTDETLWTRESHLNLFFDWLGKQRLSLKDVFPATNDAYFLENKARDWKKSTSKRIGNPYAPFSATRVGTVGAFKD
jgi:hypothetical protein